MEANETDCARCPKPIGPGQRYLRTADNRLIHFVCATSVERGESGEAGLLSAIWGHGRPEMAAVAGEVD